MRVDVRDPETGRKIGRIEVSPEERPTRARIAAEEASSPSGDSGRDIYLDWEASIDDSGRLRSCIVCGCRDLYASRAFPQLTGFVVVLAFAGAAVGISGLANEYPFLYAVLIVVLALDVASLIFPRRHLICYRCRSRYSELEISRHYGRWDRAIAERHARSAARRLETVVFSRADVALDEFD